MLQSRAIETFDYDIGNVSALIAGGILVVIFSPLVLAYFLIVFLASK